eukprot:TRINITY_DN357_c0_g1_i3.p2 TRINITY_DN357_c0_g1~~TRINITY_DN357_c0_g1_i3.p2  ORF type:complete len:501 (+),score=298.38 TRINITY_DN357_c0_g1_i3:68-1570(+)
MKVYAGVVALAAFIAVSVRGDDEEEYVPNVEFVRNLTDKNFKEATDKEDLLLMFFYSRKCGACKQLKPYFYDACKRLAEREEGPIPCAMIEADENPTTKRMAEITAYPTVKVMRNGHQAGWVGSMSRTDGLDDRIYDYMMNQVGASSVEIETAAEVKEKFKKKAMSRAAVLGYFSTKTSIDYKYYMQVAHSFRNHFDFYHVSNTQALEDLGYYSKGGSVAVFRPWGGKQFKMAYKGLIFKQKLYDFVLENMLPPVQYVDYDTLKNTYQLRSQPIVRGLIWEDFRDSQEEPMKNTLAPLAEKFKDELQFVIMGEGAHTQQNRNDLQGKGVIMIHDPNDDKKKFKWEPAVDGELEEWLAKYINKDLKPHVKSEAPFEPVAPGEVQPVSGNTFDKYVMDPTKDVMIEFYAPWCGHCKRFSPIYDELAETLKDEKNILIAKIDNTANENTYKNYKVGSFPTIKWATSKDKLNPVLYEGAREVEDIVAWIKEHATVKLSMSNEEL